MAGLDRIAQAAFRAARAHSGHRRKGPGDVPYINHPLEVAARVAAAGAAEPAASAAMLHDVVEDSEITAGEIAAAFGPDVARAVEELTDAPGWEALPLAERKARQAERARGLSTAAGRVKLADQTANLLDRRAAIDVFGAGALRDYLEGARAIGAALRGTDSLLEGELAAAAEALERALAEGAGPAPRGLAGPPRAPGLHAAETARADFTEAALYAARRHARQRRKAPGGEPYVNHVLEVTARLARVHSQDSTLLLGALLHDVVEDTEATLEEVAGRYGPATADLVAEVSDDKSLPREVRKRLQVETAPDRSARARRLKLADLAANVGSLVHDAPADWGRAREAEYLDWARRVAEGCAGADAELAAAFEAEAARLERKLSGATGGGSAR
ncbi:MAG: HD domain-containing protein [Pseudomonadota bacterium]